MDNMIDINKRHILLAALSREDPAQDSDSVSPPSRHRFNWLDAASATQLDDVTERVLLSLAQRMAIRSSGRLETAFAIDGYGGSDSVLRDSYPRAIKAFFDQNAIFYQKLKRRLVEIRHIELLSGQAKEYPFENMDDDGRKLSLYLQYEGNRRINIVSGQEIVTPRFHWQDFLWLVSEDMLDESTDAIVLAAASRTAIRSSLRLEVMWKTAFDGDDERTGKPVPLLDEYVEERNAAVKSYLDIREEQAKAAYSQSLIDRHERSGSVATESPDLAPDA